MGNAWATNDLPALATLVMTMMAGLPMAMWFYDSHFMSWSLSTCLIVVWTTAISYCFGLQNPLAGLTGTDFDQGLYLLGVLIILCLVASLVGSFVCYVLDTAEPIPVYALFPLSVREMWTQKVKVSDGGGGDLQLASKALSGLNRWDMVNIPRPWFHVIMTTVLFCVTVMAPTVLYNYFMNDISNNNDIALGCIIAIPVIGYFLIFLFWYYWPDPFVWGPNKRNIKKLGYRYLHGNNLLRVESDTKDSNFRIYKTVLVLAIIHVLSNVILGFVRYTHLSVNYSWVAGYVIVGATLLCVLIACFVLYAFRNKEVDHCYIQPQSPQYVDDGSSNTYTNNDTSIDTTQQEQEQEELKSNYYSTPNQIISQRLSKMGVV